MSLLSTDTKSIADTKSILQAVDTATTDLGFCRNRVWAVAKSLPGGPGQFAELLPQQENLPHKAKKEDHELCTFDFCEQSRVNFTLVKQRHEGSCDQSRCKPKRYNLELVANAVDTGQRTAWDLTWNKNLQHNERYIAISHVWSDGTGAGNQAPGHVNNCLVNFFQGFADKFDCNGVWWDTICIPTTKDLREKALKRMHNNYIDAAVTLVHDCFLRECEWIDADSACFYILMSPWFSRGWTALELQMSHKVHVIFKGPSGPITKDLDEDILQAKGLSISRENEIAKGILRRLRGNKVSQLNDLLVILGSRYTSWPRDMAIISGLMIGIEMPDNYANQRIYQEILQKIGTISHAHLFHNSATMTNGYNWCPTNLYDLPVTNSEHSLQIEENGNLFGQWNFILLDDIKDKRFISGHAHPLIEAKVFLAQQEEEKKHILLIEPGLDSQETGISRGLLVKPSVKPDNTFLDCYCDYVGPVYFHSPLMKSEIKDFGQTLVTFHVGHDKTSHDGSYQSTQMEKSARSMIEEIMKYPQNPDHRKRQTGSETIEIYKWDQLKLGDEFIKAVLDDKPEKVENLLKKVDEPDRADTSGWSALHHAAWRGHEEEPLHLAAEHGHKGLVDVLLEDSTRDLPRDDGLNALHLAARIGSTGIVDKLLQENWAINATDDKERTALHLAVFNGYKEPAKLLVEEGADVNAQKKDDLTLVLLATQEGNDKAIEILCSLGANIEAQDKYGQTPLHQAAEMNQVEAIKILVELGANIESQDEYGRTPLHQAAVDGQVKAIKILVKLGANLESLDESSQTPLHQAATDGQIDAIKILYRLGANLEAQDEIGLTPLDLARETDLVGTIEILNDLIARSKQV